MQKPLANPGVKRLNNPDGNDRACVRKCGNIGFLAHSCSQEKTLRHRFDDNRVRNRVQSLFELPFDASKLAEAVKLALPFKTIHRKPTMPLPFPGMDPYLEDPAIWPDYPYHVFAASPCGNQPTVAKSLRRPAGSLRLDS